MPLSDEELRLLEQMERALAAEDPKFVSALQGHGLERTARLRVVGASVVFLAGLGVLFVGALSQLTAVMVLGFVVMLGSATVGLHVWRGRHIIAARLSAHDGQAMEQHPAGGAQRHDAAPAVRNFRLVDGGRRSRRKRGNRTSRTNRSQAGFMQRVEERWQRRRHEGP